MECNITGRYTFHRTYFFIFNKLLLNAYLFSDWRRGIRSEKWDGKWLNSDPLQNGTELSLL